MSLLASVLQVWTVVFLVLKFADHQTNGNLSRYLVARQINLRFCFFSFYTTRLNAAIETRARRYRHLLNYFYSLGVLFGFFGLILSLLLLSTNAYVALIEPFQLLSPSFHHVPSQASSTSSLALPLGGHSELAAATVRGPSARIPFLHKSQRPWWVPEGYWRRLAPRDHAAWHSQKYRLAKKTDPLLNQALLARYPATNYNGIGERGGHLGQSRRELLALRVNRPYGEQKLGSSGSLKLKRVKESGDRMMREGIVNSTVAVAVREGDDTEEKQAEQILATFSETGLQIKGEIDDAHKADEKLPVVSHQLVPEGSERTSEGAHASRQRLSHNTFLTPLVPGVTVPRGDLWYMIVAVLVSAIVHELGHAIAASIQSGKVSGVGGFLALVLPGAYVRITGLEDMTSFAQLKVFCAGPWHNIVLAALALVVVGWLPLLSVPFFTVGTGAFIASVPQSSPLRGYVEPGDVFLSLGRFRVRDGGASFRHAVKDLMLTNDTVGFCVPESVYRQYIRADTTCCEDQFLQNMDLGASLRKKCFRVQGIERRRSCIDPAVVSHLPTCRLTSDCARSALDKNDPAAKLQGVREEDLNFAKTKRGLSSAQNMRPFKGSSRRFEQKLDKHETSSRDKTSCFLPILPGHQQLIDVRVRKVSSGEILHFFYEGYPYILGEAVTVSSYIPRFLSSQPPFLTRLLAFLDIPNMIERLLQYVSSISMALGILNMAPVFFLDGEMSSLLFVRLLSPKVSPTNAILTKQIIVWTGTVLLLINLVASIFDTEGWS